VTSCFELGTGSPKRSTKPDDLPTLPLSTEHGTIEQIGVASSPAGVVKCNIDAGIFDTEQRVGMGACLRDEKGHFIATMTTNTDAGMTAAEGEAWGLYQGIKWITSSGYHKVVFELDCKMVVDDIHNNYPNHSEYGSIIQDCKNILDLYNDFVVVFTRRQANGSAHALARAALSHASRSTFDVIPNCIATIIINEMH
jgi:ribonuclease HI